MTDHLDAVPAGVRPIVDAARRLISRLAPDALELPYDSRPPRSPSAMWKLARYRLGGSNVVGIGTFRRHSALWFYRGRELEDGGGLLEGTGKDSRFIPLRSVSDVQRRQVEELIRAAFELERGRDRR